MYALIKQILSGIINTTSTESSGEREINMLNLLTNVPELDRENMQLFQASDILEQIGNDPNPTANEFYAQLAVSGIPQETHEDIIMAAISIEAMMKIDLTADGLIEPTIH